MVLESRVVNCITRTRKSKYTDEGIQETLKIWKEFEEARRWCKQRVGEEEREDRDEGWGMGDSKLQDKHVTGRKTTRGRARGVCTIASVITLGLHARNERNGGGKEKEKEIQIIDVVSLGF